MFHSILVAVDGSSNSDRAVRAAASIASRHGSELTVCHVSYIPEQYRADLADSLEEGIHEEGRRILDHAAEVAIEEGVKPAKRLLSEGHPAEAIVALADELDVDLIVVGARGRARDAGRALGSVGSTVVETSVRSVLVVRG